MAGFLGDVVDNVGTGLGINELGFSEILGGGSSSNTGRISGGSSIGGLTTSVNAGDSRGTFSAGGRQFTSGGSSGSWLPSSSSTTMGTNGLATPTSNLTTTAARAAAANAATVASNTRRNINVKQGGYEGDARSTAQGNRMTYNNNAQDFVTNIRTGQNTINSGRINNALNLRRSMASIASGIRDGIRSGAVNLSNMNAMDSGASEAMARAFAKQGNDQAGSVNNDAQLKENELATTQTNLGMQREQGLGRLKSWRDGKVNEISTGLYQKLAELDATAQGEGINGGVDMGIRDRIVSEASSALDQVDAMTQGELAKISGLDYGQVQAEASKMDAAGAVASNPFSVETGNVQFGQPGSTVPGAPIGPIGTTPRYRDEEQYPIAAWNKKDTQVA